MFNRQTQIKVVDRIDQLSKSLTAEQIEALYQCEKSALMLESVTLEELENTLLFRCEPVPQMMLEAFNSKASQLAIRVKKFANQLERKTPNLTCGEVEIGKPHKSGAIAVQIAKIPLSDGQSVSIAFHTPDNDPLKINADDTLIAFRFLLNSRDVTHTVAPKGSQDISLKEATTKLGKLAEKNSDKFSAAQAKKNADAAALQSAQEKAQELEEEAAQLNTDATNLEIQSDEVDARIKRLKTQISTQNEIQDELRKQLAKKQASVAAVESVNASDEPASATVEPESNGSIDPVVALFRHPKLKAASDLALKFEGGKRTFSTLGTIADIDVNGAKGMDRALFVSNIADRIKTLHKNGNQEAVDAILTMVAAYNDVALKAAVTARNGIWKLGNIQSVEDISDEDIQYTARELILGWLELKGLSKVEQNEINNLIQAVSLGDINSIFAKVIRELPVFKNRKSDKEEYNNFLAELEAIDSDMLKRVVDEMGIVAVKGDDADEATKGKTDEEKQLLALDPNEFTFGAIYYAEGAQDGKTISSRIRAFITQGKKQGKLPKDLKISVKNQRGGFSTAIIMRLTDLPESIRVNSDAALQSAIDNDGRLAHGQSRYSDELTNLIKYVEAYVDQFNHISGDAYGDYGYDHAVYGNHLQLDAAFSNERWVQELDSFTELHQGEVDTKVAERSEQNAAPNSQRKVRYTKYPRNAYPKSITEATERLQTARKNIIKNGYIGKYDDAELLDIVQSGELANERFHVRIMNSNYLEYEGKPGLLGAPMQGETGFGAKYWSTTFEQLEDVDTDPRLICAKLGLPYTKGDKLSYVIIDTHQSVKIADTKVLVPTHENLAKFTREELPDSFTAEQVDLFFTDKFQKQYAEHYDDALSSGAMDSEWDTEGALRYFQKKINDEELITLLKVRLKMQDAIGNNQHFLGNGLTKTLLPNNGNYGAVETFNFERKLVPLDKFNGSIHIIKDIAEIN